MEVGARVDLHTTVPVTAAPTDTPAARWSEKFDEAIRNMPEEQAAERVRALRKKGYRREADLLERIRRLSSTR